MYPAVFSELAHVRDCKFLREVGLRAEISPWFSVKREGPTTETVDDAIGYFEDDWSCFDVT